MHRMGHGSMRAALIYQHATTARDRAIADSLGALVGSGREEQDGDAGQDALADLDDYVIDRIARRVRSAVESRTAAYLEHGAPVR